MYQDTFDFDAGRSPEEAAACLEKFRERGRGHCYKVKYHEKTLQNIRDRAAEGQLNAWDFNNRVTQGIIGYVVAHEFQDPQGRAQICFECRKAHDEREQAGRPFNLVTDAIKLPRTTWEQWRSREITQNSDHSYHLGLTSRTEL